MGDAAAAEDADGLVNAAGAAGAAAVVVGLDGDGGAAVESTGRADARVHVAEAAAGGSVDSKMTSYGGGGAAVSKGESSRAERVRSESGGRENGSVGMGFSHSMGSSMGSSMASSMGAGEGAETVLQERATIVALANVQMELGDVAAAWDLVQG